MTGLVTTEERAAQINERVAQMHAAMGKPCYWLPGMHQIFSGPRAGKWLVPTADEMMETRMFGTTKLKDIAKLGEIMRTFGPLHARVNVPDEYFVDPNAPPE